MLNTNIISQLRKKLRQNIDTKTRDTAHRYFKEEVKFYGVKTALVLRLAQEYFQQIKALQKQEIFNLCEELLKSGYCEESFIAFEWAYTLRNRFEKEDFGIFEKWLKQYVSNWAQCDTLCNHTMAAVVEKYPEFLVDLKIWTKSKSRWVRRAAAVTLILPARNGKFLKDIFEIADILLLDKDDLIQKGYGWMLKEASKSHLKETFDYVMKNKKIMPRTALRYAIEKMPASFKKQAMAR